MSDLEERIIAFVAEQAGVKQRRVQLSSCLSDLEMEGDDTVEFLAKFGETFHADLAALDIGRHVFPEGSGPATCGIAAIPAIFVSAAIQQTVAWIPAWALPIALTLIFALAYRLLLVKEKIPIAVRDLADAASSGKWVKPHDVMEGKKW